MKIHDVIFIAHLESAIDFAEDSYRRRRLSTFVVVVDGEEKYEIEKLLRKRIVKRGREWFVQYLIWWLGYGSKADTWELERELLRYVKETVEEYEVANSNVALFTILRCESFSAFWHRGDVFVFHGGICYGYGDSSASTLSRSICLAKIQALLSNCVCLKSTLSSEWLGKQISS